MTFVFWQGIISIHQKTFLEALALRAGAGKVLLVVENDITPYRKNMGWDVPEIENVEIVLAPAASRIKEIVAAHQDAIHIFGGIRVGPMLTAGFETCIRHHCKIGVMTEPYNEAGYKGRLRKLKYQFYKLRDGRHIQFVLAIGKSGVSQYLDLGYNPQIIFPWAYFITVPIVPRRPAGKTVRVIYAGRLEPAKGISRFLNNLLQFEPGKFRMDIYGSGSEEVTLKQRVAETDHSMDVQFYPFLNYNELLGKYSEYDWVVLPSAGKDGWGVIVSEGLLNGLKAVCSSICGVSRVITSGSNGLVFDWNSPGSCNAAIATMLESNGFARPELISDWAAKSLSAEAGADYFLKIIENIYNDSEKPGMPWEVNRI